MAKHKCPYDNCMLSFSRPYRLRIHIQRHQGIKEFSCSQCDRSYHRQQHLKRHVDEAHQNKSRLEQPIPCDHCDRQFNTTWGLHRHQAKIKNPKVRTREHSCTICGCKFFNHDELERHSLRHERFKCDIPMCPFATRLFNWTVYFKHMEDYHSEPFECDYCGEQFVRKAQLRTHIQTHMPNFPCTIAGCNKTYALIKNLSNHIRSVHGNRTYKCNVVGCDWNFKYKTCFKRHIKVHESNGRIVPMAERKVQKNKNKSKCVMAEKLAALAFKI
ncbi:transcription factor IIIA-like [Adelges cooleyi]|uniref:transcription factor IIIA-like n=1 Tax=Adelges cooleyi TaxID=133065 RepID=UPI0021804C21|nr:transcription factor IIIA-like [Adelges cooleyi]XP_050429671.1 transcription factor IIIA-like [Adelges cooleyi]